MTQSDGYGLAQSGKVVYFRARQGGACTYFNDSREGPLTHGLCWAPYCNELQVVDVPGDHFSLLRQDVQDMGIIVDTLQMVLSAFGWHTTIKRDQKIYNMNDVSLVSWWFHCYLLGACCQTAAFEQDIQQVHLMTVLQDD